VFRAKSRAVVLAAAVAGVTVAVVLFSGAASGGSNGETHVDGSTDAVLYDAGHRPVAPDFTGTTLTGSRLDFSAYRAKKVVVLNFWGSWCVPCREEAPALAVLAEQYRSAGVAFLGVDVQDTTASAEAFVHDFGVTYPSVTDSSSAITMDFTSVVPIAGTPTTLVIDRTGHIAGAVFGMASYTELATILGKVVHS
jgi:thiol-disulfide isomerase/thioredoxin